jgi:xylulokinase
VYALRDITDRLSAMKLGGEEIRVIGGGSRSALWLQIKADVTRIPVRQVLNPEPTALGAAMLAGVGAGMFRDAPQATQCMTKLADFWYEPDPANAAVYEDAYQNYRRLFDALEGLIT